ncbi:MAG: DUF58 domain-containing protein [Thermoleophilia bacterium]|jgi:uncharacterized protein (DUF58 family)
MGASADAILRRVELRIGRRLDGLLQGERRGRRPGPGGEPALTRGYEPGDDVRWVDWPLSARSGAPMVRVPEIDPVLTAWALVDCSPSMHYGTLAQTKLALAEEVLAGIGLVMRRRGDRLGVIATRAGGVDLVRPPRADRRGLVAAIAAVRALPAPEEGGGRTDLVGAINALGRIARHRGAVIVVSDFPEGEGLERAIGGLGRRHDVIAIEVRDRRERDLPAVGSVVLRDVETGRRRTVDTADPRFRARFAKVARQADDARAAMLARAGARHAIAETGGDWVGPLIEVMNRGAERRLARP